MELVRVDVSGNGRWGPPRRKGGLAGEGAAANQRRHSGAGTQVKLMVSPLDDISSGLLTSNYQLASQQQLAPPGHSVSTCFLLVQLARRRLI